MKVKKSLIVLLSAFVLTSFIVLQNGCKEKNEDSGPGIADLKISLQGSGQSRSMYDSINLDLQQVSIHTSSDTSEASGWFDLETMAGIYNLLDYVNADTIIAFDSTVQAQTISQIRLLLGDNNTVVIGGETFELKTPSAQSSGLKIQIHTSIEPNSSYKLVLDFDPEESIIVTGDSSYLLKPVIKTTVEKQ